MASTSPMTDLPDVSPHLLPPTVLAGMPTKAALPPLYEVEDSLLALLDTDEAGVMEGEEEFRRELAAGLETAAQKRDSTAGFIKMCEYAAAAAGAESQRLLARKRGFENAAERLRGYVVKIIESLPRERNRKGEEKLRKLEGNKFTMSARACQASLEITDAAKVPEEFLTVTVAMPNSVWRRLIEAAGAYAPKELSAIADRTGWCKPQISIDNAKVKAALMDGRDVPGADLITGKNSLVVK